MDLAKVTKTGIDPLFVSGLDVSFGSDKMSSLMKNHTFFEMMSLIMGLMDSHCRRMLEDEVFQGNLKKIGFDLMIVDGIVLLCLCIYYTV